jgi:hypothetical protein
MMCRTPNAVDNTDDDMSNSSVEDRMLGVSARKIKALTVKMETVTLTDKGR